MHQKMSQRYELQCSKNVYWVSYLSPTQCSTSISLHSGLGLRLLLTQEWRSNNTTERQQGNRRLPQQFAGIHSYTWMERGTVRVKCLVKDHNTVTQARALTLTTQSWIQSPLSHDICTVLLNNNIYFTKSVHEVKCKGVLVCMCKCN